MTAQAHPTQQATASVDFTVAIPTYNGATRLPALLEALRSQHVSGLNWEILVVDNNSRDRTAAVVQEIQAEWASLPYSPSLRYEFEDQQGAAFARQKAMQSAHSRWVGFLDDDIVPATDWVAAAVKFAEAHPEAGAFGGQIHPAFAAPPPPDFERIQSFLAIRERGDQAHLYRPEHLVLPPSAAWVVQRPAWLSVVPPKPQLSGRVKGSMMQGDDYEPLLFLHKADYPIWYCPDMHVHHQIPKQRLERDYLVALSQGCGQCVCHLQMLRVEPWQAPFTLVKLTLGNAKRLFQHYAKYGRTSSADLVTQCERAFFISSLLSPVNFLRTRFAP